MNKYVISDDSDIDGLISALESVFPRLKETSETVRLEIYDTFDWRLYHRGWQLVREEKRFSILCLSSGRLVAGFDVDGKKDHRFGWDFPPSDAAELLAPVLEMRALIPMAPVEKTLKRLAICNGDDKTVARVEIETLATAGRTHRSARCRLLPIKGYGQDSRRIRALLKAQNLEPEETPGLVELLRIAGLDPGGYSSKVNVALEPRMPAAAAVQLILKNLVAVMHQNLSGVRKDIDSEFLHDLRVAVRRARSLLSQTKGVLDSETTAALQAHLKAMGNATGQIRDLDVYLLKKAAYVQMVPEVLQPGVFQLFRVLQRRRRGARNRMLKVMAAAEFSDALGALDAFLQTDPVTDADTPAAGPVGELARTVIYKRYRRIIGKGRRISEDTPDEKLHELRIDCKKLRYLLEFFTSLFPADDMKRLIKQLKRLQENLGDFNDLCVQQEFLSEYLANIRPQTSQAVMLSAATGGLIARLRVEQTRVRSEFLGVFEYFSSTENEACFKALFT